MKNEIFVFGSNLKGIHGAGAAKVARQSYGAVVGVGKGRTGNSYAIPTKYNPNKTRPLDEIKEDIFDFIHYASFHKEVIFRVTRIGCGLAGFKDEEIAPLFRGSPANCMYDSRWIPWLIQSDNNMLRKYFVAPDMPGPKVEFFAMMEFSP